MPAPPSPKAAAPKRPPAARRVYSQEDEIEDYNDPFFFTDQPCDDDEYEFFPSSTLEVPQYGKKKGTSAPYGKEELWEQVHGER